MPLHIVWISGTERPELRRVLTELQSSLDCRILTTREQMESWTASPDVVVLAYGRPGERLLADPACVHKRWPSARVVCLLSDLCCGEKRTNAGVVEPSFYCHQLQPGHVVRQLMADLSPELAETTPRAIGVYARTPSYRRSLAEAIHGHYPLCAELAMDSQLEIQGLDVVIYEAHPFPAERLHEIQRLRHRHPTARLVALVSYPRAGESDELQKLHVVTVAQPFQLAELHQALQAAAESNLHVHRSRWKKSA